jgi:hypothetical protein
VNRSNSNVASDRPNATAGEKIELDDPTANQWFNIRAFQLQPLFTFGNAGRNTIIGPGIVAWDFSTLKNFNINESSYVQFRFECFNCANHPVLGDPAINMSLNQLDANGIPIAGTGSFGRITSTRFDMRQLQFGLKIVF